MVSSETNSNVRGGFLTKNNRLFSFVSKLVQLMRFLSTILVLIVPLDGSKNGSLANLVLSKFVVLSTSSFLKISGFEKFSSRSLCTGEL